MKDLWEDSGINVTVRRNKVALRRMFTTEIYDGRFYLDLGEDTWVLSADGHIWSLPMRSDETQSCLNGACNAT